jgi:hypothetical protein
VRRASPLKAADFETDFGDAMVAGQQQLLGLLYAPAGDEFVRRLVEGLGEQAVEVEGREASLPSGFFQENGSRIVLGQVIARPAEAGERGGVEGPHAGRIDGLR